MDDLRIGRVVSVDHAAHAVSLIMANDGTRLENVPVLATGGTDWGRVDLPDVVRPKAGGDYMQGADFDGPREMNAVVATIRGAPVVLGFLLPQVGQMTFADRNRRVDRHVSGVYSTVDAAGNVEFYHPSGSFVRMGTSGAHEDLTGKDFDGRWKVPAAAPVHMHLEVSSGEGAAVAIDLAPDGSVTVHAAGAVLVQAPSVTLDSAATHCTGALTVDGLFTYKAGMAGTGGGAGTSISGTITHTGGSLSSNGVVLHTHGHSGVQAGGNVSGGPVSI